MKRTARLVTLICILISLTAVVGCHKQRQRLTPVDVLWGIHNQIGVAVKTVNDAHSSGLINDEQKAKAQKLVLNARGHYNRLSRIYQLEQRLDKETYGRFDLAIALALSVARGVDIE